MNKKKKFFLTTNSKYLYLILSLVSKKYLEKKNNESYELKSIKNKKFYFEFFKFFLIEFLKGNLFNNKKFVQLRYRGFSLGRYVLSTFIRRSLNYSLLHKKYFFIQLLFQAVNIINSNKEIDKNIVGIYIDHGQFINGLYIEIFSKFKKNVAIYNYPRGLISIDFSNIKKNKTKCSFEGILQLDFKNKKISENEKKIAKSKINHSLKNPKIIPWLKKTKFFKFRKQNFKPYSHVIYAHSFTDDQLMWGYDEFIDMHEWLIFTIEELLNNKKYFIIKSHPNFFTITKSRREYEDKLMFYKIKKKYKSKYIKFIDYPLKNDLFLSNLNKKTILISHHGTAIFEGIINNFKIISSRSTLWNRNFNLTNSWENQNEYKKLLRSNWKNLSLANNEDFFKICHTLYCNKYNIYGKSFWFKKFLESINLNLYDSEKKISSKINELIQSKNLNNIVNKITHAIEDLN
tara:strand:- start:5397 stop:6773 length:1377 start_codon:yes stop_codon:yes gene_type:complete